MKLFTKQITILSGPIQLIAPTNEFVAVPFAQHLRPPASALLNIDIFEFANQKNESGALLLVDQRARNFFGEVLKAMNYREEDQASAVEPDQFHLVVVDFPWELDMGEHDVVPGVTTEQKTRSVFNMLDMASKFVAPGGNFHPGMNFFSGKVTEFVFNISQESCSFTRLLTLKTLGWATATSKRIYQKEVTHGVNLSSETKEGTGLWCSSSPQVAPVSFIRVTQVLLLPAAARILRGRTTT